MSLTAPEQLYREGGLRSPSSETEGGLYRYSYRDAELPPLGREPGSRSIYFDEFTEHCHEGDWNWCSHCGDGGTWSQNPQWRRREHFENFHRRDVRRAKRSAAAKPAIQQEKRSSPAYGTPARWCAGCEKVIPSGAPWLRAR